MILPPDTQSDEHTLAPEPYVIKADIAACFTYASYQNAIPVIRSVSLASSATSNIENCRLELRSVPPFLKQKTWAIDRVLAGDEIVISDRKVELDAAYLAGLNEAERGEIQLNLMRGDELLAQHVQDVRLLARDEWGGVADMAQLLPAFVMPNDPAIAAILRNAGSKLASSGHPSGLDGYQAGDSQRAFTLAAAIYSAVAELALFYAEPPVSFERRGQKVRRPSTIVSDKLATCLDTSLLFAASLEAAGLNPTLLMFDGHAAAGVWIVPKFFPTAVEQDLVEVRKALASRELVVFETTGVCHRPPLTLNAARQAVEHRLDEQQASSFVAAIDVRRARSGGITPLASHEPTKAGANVADDAAVWVPLAPALSSSELPAEVVEVKPSTAQGRIDRWQKKLLDLTLRNRLLNFPDSKKTIPFLCTDVGYLEDRLSEGGVIKLISLPDQNPLGERDAALYREVHGRDLQRGFAADALQRGELPSTLGAKDLEARLIDLHRQVRNDFAEGGANTLFLAVGFLKWKKRPQDERTYRAPILLVPVKLERRSASSSFSLRFHEDEPRFNATLVQFLARDFDLQLNQFSGELPLDESGIDVPRILTMMRQAVRDVPGMEVVDETALSTFSFAKFLMWKDLVERTNALRNNRVVRHLIDTPELAFAGSEGGRLRDGRDLDKQYAPSDIVCLLPADSSQIAASLAAAEGQDFVIVGPPGTGKSQTIANMIANCLAAKKTVLFVAEKTAALDVVYRRLREHGLGDQCLELHSNKADRKRFLSQLKASWEFGLEKDDNEWVSVNEKLRVRRDQLNAYAEALHKDYPNGWTPYYAIGVALRGRSQFAPQLNWSTRAAHDRSMLMAIEQVVEEIGLSYNNIRTRPVLSLVEVSEWSGSWQESLLASAYALDASMDALGKATAAYISSIGLPPRDDVSEVELEALASLARSLQDSEGYDVRVAFERDFAQLQQAHLQFKESVEAYRDSKAALSATYNLGALATADLSSFELRWREASANFWPLSALGKQKVRKLLQGFVTEGSAQPGTDLPLLRVMEACKAALSGNPLALRPIGLEGLQADLPKLQLTLQKADAVRSAVRLPGHSNEQIKLALRSIAQVLPQAPQQDRIRPAGARLLAAFSQFEKARMEFSELAGKPILIEAGEGRLSRLRMSLRDIQDAKSLLRDWAAWCGLRRKAVALDLGPLVDAVEKGLLPASSVKESFQLAYARWWLPGVLDADPVLREFRRFQHDNAVTEFREIDDLVRTHATQRVITAIAHGLPPVQGVPRQSELGVLRHQMELQRPSRSIREMISAMPENFSKLAPCMLMSPLSIAQYLPPDQALFDVVIFDEASQITTWDAVGAIARARQTIIVGDPKQLPPTNFFGRNEEEEEVEDFERDLESILDEAKASGIPVRDLRWHYRSQSESLIAFSNHHYYQNRLITFPSPSVEDRAVQLRKVPEGIYDRGKSRTNRIEAEKVSAEAVARMLSWLNVPPDERPTLGIITFNAQQQSLIMDYLDSARRSFPQIEWFFADDRYEPTIVKNLENVQGDERDVILFSITFTQDSAGKRTMDFGALNRDGGERRLNVAVTRARQELIVFSGFTSDLIDTSRTKALGAHHLKTFLDYAERGSVALPAATRGSMGGFESPFEEAVAAQLEARGWQLVPQVGISGFRIDIGVRHPELPGRYLAGIECDGATYHSSATARDRDKVREQVLRGLGWQILRVWSTDWWFDPDECAGRLNAELEACLEESRRVIAEAEANPENTQADSNFEPTKLPSDGEAVDDIDGAEPEIHQMNLVPPSQASASDEKTSTQLRPPGTYYAADLSQFSPDPEKFFELSYRNELQAIVDAVIEQEGPVRIDTLAQRVARAHGWLRTGGRIKERIELHLRNLDRTLESSGDFIWKKGSVINLLPYRPAADPQSRRAIADVPLAELASFALEHRAALAMPDAPLELARLLGVERLAGVSRSRLEEAIFRAKEHLSHSEKPVGI